MKPLAGTRILFVDDDPAICRSFARSLRRREFLVDTAPGALEALYLAQSVEYSVVVTDLHMPGLDGLGLIERMRRTRPNTAFIVLTGANDIDLPACRSGRSNIASVLEKPWDEDELVATIARAAELHEDPVKSSSIPLRRTTVLLVEDNAGDSDLVAAYLAGEQVDLFHVERLDSALHYLHDQKVDVILTDLTLPDARGLDCVRRLQRASTDSALIVLSGVANEKLALQAVRLGAQDFLEKGASNAYSLPRAIRYGLERKRAERQLARLAHFDSLTGLANRSTFRSRLDHMLLRARRHAIPFAVLFLDLDRFKAINDTLGHDAGDQLLQQVGARLTFIVREYDTVARFGGDEFAILLEDLQDADSPREVVARINEAFQVPFELDGNPVNVEASIGVGCYPGEAETSAGLLKSADQAMYASKKLRASLALDSVSSSTSFQTGSR